VVVPILVVSTLILGLSGTILSLIGFPTFASRHIGGCWARLNAWVSLMRVCVTGSEFLDPNESYVFIANHQSQLDIYAIYGFLGRDIKWVIKQELRSVPILGLVCESMGHIFVDRSNTETALQSINDARERITDGVSIVFFPEGTRSRDGKLLPFKKGAFRFAQQMQLPIVPITIANTNNLLPSGTTNLAAGLATVIIHEPIATADVDISDNSRLAEDCQRTIGAPLQTKRLQTKRLQTKKVQTRVGC
jgi:1-acyl-sn-glycerol-3-phosphate acyltransferase